jgi:hypothetical protein
MKQWKQQNDLSCGSKMLQQPWPQASAAEHTVHGSSSSSSSSATPVAAAFARAPWQPISHHVPSLLAISLNKRDQDSILLRVDTVAG